MSSRVLLPLLLVATSGFSSAAAADKPNVLLIMADDLGYSDVGCYGGEIETPHLDALASGGLRYTQFYNTARCWPTRAALMTGYYAQQVRRDSIPGVRSGSQGARPAWARMLPELLKPHGYRSYHSGKWHLDGPRLVAGYDRSYSVEDHNRYFSPQNHLLDDKPLPPIALGEDYYKTTAMAQYGIDFLREHAEKHVSSPFFLYLAFTAPHFPLHAPQADIDRCRERYRAGWDKIREARFERQRALGLVNCELAPREEGVGPPYHFPDALEKLGPGEINHPLAWDALTDEQRAFQIDKMAVHAAMVEVMDREIGRVVDQLKRMQAFDDTLILFLSDNGASAEIMVRGDGHDPAAPAGSAGSYLCLGPGWSTAANTPFRRHKTWVHEGGIATPLIAHWPKGIATRGELRHTPGHAVDIVPTILELAGGAMPTTHDGKPVPASPARSLAPTFAADAGATYRDPSREIWWLHEGNRALRFGDWKLVAAKGDPWSLFNLATDRAEQHDLAAEHPDKVADLEARWNKQLAEITAQATADADAPQSSAPVKQLILPGESFLIGNRPAFILWPAAEKRKTPQPWVLYAPTLPAYPDEHERWMHEQFLEAGIAVAGIDVGEAYGSPQGRQGFNALYRELTGARGFAKKPCLLGRSRGGLWVTSWAAAHPDRVAGIAGIYPVFDVRSYPGLDRAAPAYKLTPAELETQLDQLNPIAKAGTLAKARIPVYIIHGDEDKVVPLEVNSAALASAYRDAGADEALTLNVVAGQGHNFWEGFFRCRELIDFAIARARAGAE